MSANDYSAYAVPVRVRVLDPRRYHASFGRSVRSELRKLTVLRSFWAVVISMIVIYLLITGTAASAQRSITGDSMRVLDAAALTTGVSFVIIFSIVQGTLAVTNEYSSNTMRTTALSDPNRYRSYFAKLTAVGIAAGLANFVMILLSAIIYMSIVGASWDFDNGNGRALIVFWLVLTTGAIMSTSLGYALRSTAGTITVIFLGLFVAPVIQIISTAWVQNTMINYLPLVALQASVRTTLVDTLGVFNLSWSTALVTWLGYVVVLGALGLFRYTRSDV